MSDKLKPMPPLGSLIRTQKSVCSSGRVVLTEHPTAMVVGHHIDGIRFFHQFLKGGRIEINTRESDQWGFPDAIDVAVSYPY